MTDGRDILARIRVARAGDPEAAARRIAKHPRGTIPAMARPADKAAALALFRRKAEAAGASLTEVRTRRDVPDAVADFLQRYGLPRKLRTGRTDPAMPWEGAGLAILAGAAEATDMAGFSEAFCGIAETGTLMLVSGPDTPASINFLPENHVVLLRTTDITGCYEEAWDRLRAASGEGVMPRAVNWITGPSRTADIEQTLVMGAHGPKRLHILLLSEGEETDG